MYTISDASLKQLEYVLNCIRSAVHHVDTRKDIYCTSATDYDTESLLSPHLFYHFQFRDKYCQLERVGRSNNYSIRCHGFNPDNLDYFYSDYFNQEVYQRELFGSYDNFDTAVQAFGRVCTELVKYIQPVFIF